MKKIINKQLGVSLLEITVSLVIALLIISGMTQAVVSINKNARVQLAESNIQETLLLASNRLSHSLKQSFSSPCGNISAILGTGKVRLPIVLGGNPIIDLNTLSPNVAPGILAGNLATATSEYASMNTLPLLITGGLPDPDLQPVPANIALGNIVINTANMMPNSDFIIAMEMGPKTATRSSVQSVNVMLQNRQGIPVSSMRNTANQAFMMTNCDNIDMFIGNSNNNVIQPAGNRPIAFFQDYKLGEDTVISQVDLYLYYIGMNNTGRISLYRRDLLNQGAPTVPMVDGVTNLNISWGLSNPNNLGVTQDYFSSQAIMNAIQAGGFTQQQFNNQVVSARIALTAGSVDAGERMIDGTIAPNQVGAVTLPAFTRTSNTIVSLRNKIQRQ